MKLDRLNELAGIHLNESSNFTAVEKEAVVDAIVHTFNAAMDSGEDENAPALQSAFKKLTGKDLKY